MTKKKKVKKGSKKKVVKLGPKNKHWRNDKMIAQLNAKVHQYSFIVSPSIDTIFDYSENPPKELQAFSSLPRKKSLLERICEYFTA